MNTGIYTITNKVNGKVYVGSVSRSFGSRWRVHKYDLRGQKHSNSYLQDSVNRYGIESFDFEILEECEPALCISLEQWWMNMLDSCNPSVGYNLCSVAGSSRGRKPSAETRKKMSDIRKGRKFSEEHKAAIGRAHKGRKKPRGYDARHFLGHHHTEESKQKIREAFSGAKNHRAIPVYQFSKSGEFIRRWDCGQDAATALDINSGNLYFCCKGGLKTSGGFIWRYTENIESDH